MQTDWKQEATRVAELTAMLTEFINEADYAYTKNGGIFDGKHAADVNHYITDMSMTKRSDGDAPRIGGCAVYWNYRSTELAVDQTREDAYLYISQVDIGYSHENDGFKELEVYYYDGERTTLQNIAVQHRLPSDDEIHQAVVAFWQEVDKRQGKAAHLMTVAPYVHKLKTAKNVIFHGAPGTGKTYLAKMVAAALVSDGTTTHINALGDLRDHVDIVQFHPSYDYTDFVEGLRPVAGDKNQMNIQWQAGEFYQFVMQAQAQDKQKDDTPYVFIIDEINRGELGKIFGELFSAIDPGYRGPDGAVTTQYANLHPAGTEDFYVPKNVYIIGTMNDIDRSVDTFDFAMRRRFRFINIDPSQRVEMLRHLDAKQPDALARMTRLNQAIVAHPELNANYQIGPAYFLQLNAITPAELWSDYLQPLLEEYLRGTADEKRALAKCQRAYEGESGED